MKVRGARFLARGALQGRGSLDQERIAGWYDRRAPTYASTAGEGTERLPALLDALPPGARLLEVGCGAGVDAARAAARGLRVVGVDLSAGMLRETKGRAPSAALVRADLRALPFRDASFEGILAAFALVHVPKAAMPATLEGLARVLRPGGALLAVTQEGEPAERPGAGPFLINVASEAEWRTQLGAAGLRVEATWVREPRGTELPYRKRTVLARRPPRPEP